MNDDELPNYQYHKFMSTIGLIATILMVIIIGYSIVTGQGIFHEPVQHNLTEHVVDKKILPYHDEPFSNSIHYVVLTDAHEFEMELKDYNRVHVGDPVRISVYDDNTDGYGYFCNDSFSYYGFGG